MKRFFILLTLGSLLAALAGCQSSSDTDTASAPPQGNVANSVLDKANKVAGQGAPSSVNSANANSTG